MMAITPEGKIKKLMKEAFKDLKIFNKKDALVAIAKQEPINGYYRMAASTGMGEAGVSDFVVCLKGLYIEIEAKAGKGKQSGLQKIQEQIIDASLGLYLVVSTKEEIEEVKEGLGRIISNFASAPPMLDDFAPQLFFGSVRVTENNIDEVLEKLRNDIELAVKKTSNDYIN